MPRFVRTFDSAQSRTKIALILGILESEHLTAEEIGQRIHASKSSVQRFLTHLRDEPKRVYIADYKTGPSTPAPMYAKGGKKDAKVPRKTKAQYWQEVKADPVRLARTLETAARGRAKKRGSDAPLRPIRTYDPPLIQQVQTYVEAFPGCTTREILDKLGATFGGVKQALADLQERGVVTYKHRTRAGAHWESTSRKPVHHAPLVTKPQGIFAALGV